MIELKAPMSIKNEYVLELYDKDGKLKDKAYAYNLVTNTFWQDAFKTVTGWLPFKKMRLGTGTGTPSVSDTALFKSLVEVDATVKSVQYAYPTSVATITATFPASTSAVGVITEIGFSKGNYSSYLQTHALLQDSEGNPITINKTDTDTIIVTAKVHVTVSASEQLNLVSANRSVVKKMFTNASNLSITKVALCACPLNATTSMIASKSDCTAAYSSRSFAFPTSRLASGTGNNMYINAVYASEVGYIQLPNESIFPAYELQPMIVGTGDGVTTSFNCPIPDFVENTEVVTVDGVELTRDVDYTVDPIGNSTLNASAISAYSNFAKRISGAISSSTSYLNRQFGIKSTSDSGIMIGPQDKPLLFDFGSEKLCNALFIDSLCTPYSSPSSAEACTIYLEYSNDGEAWSAATSVDTKFIRGSNAANLPSNCKNILTKFDPVSARYWRVYLTSSSSYANSKGLGSGGGNSFIGYVGDGIIFKEPPAEGAEIKIKATVNRPYKTSDYVIDWNVAVYL